MAAIKGVWLIGGLLAAILVPFQTSHLPVSTEVKRDADYTITELIEIYSLEHRTDVNLALAIAKCESELNPSAKNASSTAGGVYQFIDSTWGMYCVGDKMNAADNVSCGTKLIGREKIRHWSESVACWYPAYKRATIGQY